MRARAFIAVLVALVVAGGGAAGGQAATTSTITACVTTKTGAVKILTTAKARKKTCAKGAKKVTWNVPGRAGSGGKNGANGPSTNGTDGTNGTNGTHASPLQVYDARGHVLGQFAGISGNVQFMLISVVVDGGLYQYEPNGAFAATTGYQASIGGPVYTDATCAGQPVLTVPRRYAETLDRSTYRYVDPLTSFGADPLRAGSTTSTVPAAAPTYYAFDLGTGTCVVATGVQAGDTLVDLVPTTPPPLVVGRLTIAP